MQKIPQLVVQPRKTKRRYIYDYHAFILDETGAEDHFGKGVGISLDREIAKEKAIGEALERYCGSHASQILARTSYQSLKNIGLNPKNLVYFADSQYLPGFSYRKPSSIQLINWVEGYSLVKQQKVFVPAFAVYLGYNRLIPPEERFLPTSSCGLALQTSQEKAVIKGIFELIERDAAMITWLTKRRVPRLDLSSVELPELIYLRDKVSEEGFNMDICISTIDFPFPSVIAIVYDSKNRAPYVSFGLATEIDLEKAALKALEEALMIRNTLEILNEEDKIRQLKRPSVNNFLDHAIFYATPSRRKFWKFLLKGPLLSLREINRQYRFTEAKKHQTLKNVIRDFNNMNKEVIWVDVTDRIVKRMGYVAVKVIIPELHPMDISYNARFLGGRRLPTLLEKWQRINSYPHPFA